MNDDTNYDQTSGEQESNTYYFHQENGQFGQDSNQDTGWDPDQTSKQTASGQKDGQPGKKLKAGGVLLMLAVILTVGAGTIYAFLSERGLLSDASAVKANPEENRIVLGGDGQSAGNIQQETIGQSDAQTNDRTGAQADAQTDDQAGAQADAQTQTGDSAQSVLIAGQESWRGSLDVSAVVEHAMPGIVAITSESVQTVQYYYFGTREIPSESVGSGIIIAQSDTELLIATNYHVVEGADSMTVCFTTSSEDAEEGIIAASMKGSDATKDLAVVAVKLSDIPETVRDQIRIMRLGDSDTLQVGEKSIAIGNALGYGQSVTAGIISALNRELTVSGNTPQTYIQTDAAINLGNSGGALLNASGEVIGINSAKASANGVEGMGYAIPINEAKPVLETLVNKVTRDKVEEADRGNLGIVTCDVSVEAQQLYAIPSGAFVYAVNAGTTAEAAGIMQGDIITKLDGSSVSSSDALNKLLEYYKAGETVEVVYETGRGGSYVEKTVSLQLEKAKTDTQSWGYEGQQQIPYGGF